VAQDNIEREIGSLSFDIHNPVFLVSSLAVVALVLLIGGGLTAFQATVNATGIVFPIILLCLCGTIFKV
jgi:choline-glycine betaine transporter